MPSKSADSNTRREDAARTIDDWMVLDFTSLKLKCKFYGILASGKKEALADRLLEHLAGDPSNTENAGEEESDDGVDITINDALLTVTQEKKKEPAKPSNTTRGNDDRKARGRPPRTKHHPQNRPEIATDNSKTKTRGSYNKNSS